ncbi:hypothetical protein E4634_07575 [Mangrovimicrobium sediminis]|uniref:Tetratricopeptide repeat protein n=1 Tax=Mangrovimicrobium sediminis TaxID=2562682 RepID=A0A4Z0M3A9_9GAMM|nr:hypothetical protein [Haliea sp. SAOS-164]TGD73991.1 hypothetical protein E4634_07575 [Haliea sp. SAOS-164]
MPPRIVLSSLLAASLLLLQACAQAPQSDTPVEEQAPEISLNLPAAPQCACDAPEAHDYTFLEKGFNSLIAGDFTEAVQYFERYQRLEDSPEAAWEAGIGIAYVSSLQASPSYDPAAAARRFAALNKQPWQSMDVHTHCLLLRQSLDNARSLERRIAAAQAENSTLKDELAKREEAIKRLRELTLGQKGGAP